MDWSHRSHSVPCFGHQETPVNILGTSGGRENLTADHAGPALQAGVRRFDPVRSIDVKLLLNAPKSLNGSPQNP